MRNVERTIAYYDARAEEYARATADLDLSPLYRRFEALLPRGGRVLDAGCGSGRDAKHFLNAGYDVVAFDGSAEMVRLSSALTGRVILHLLFADLAFSGEFDGVWASASLVHVPRPSFGSVLTSLVQALRPEGVLFASLRREGRKGGEADPRLFTYWEPDELRQETAAVKDLLVTEMWTAHDIRGPHYGRWLNVIATRRVAPG